MQGGRKTALLLEHVFFEKLKALLLRFRGSSISKSCHTKRNTMTVQTYCNSVLH